MYDKFRRLSEKRAERAVHHILPLKNLASADYLRRRTSSGHVHPAIAQDVRHLRRLIRRCGSDTFGSEERHKFTDLDPTLAKGLAGRPLPARIGKPGEAAFP